MYQEKIGNLKKCSVLYNIISVIYLYAKTIIYLLKQLQASIYVYK